MTITKQCLCILIDTTDVQVFKAQPLNGTNNLGAINCSLTVAINSSVLEFMVNIFGSSGRRFDSITLSRKSNQRVVSNSSMVLPVDIYTLNLSVLTSSGFQYANFTTTVDISRSNYSASTTTTAAAASTSTLSSTPTSTPITNGELGECLLFIHVTCTCKNTLVHNGKIIIRFDVHDLHTLHGPENDNLNVFIFF